MYLYVFMCVNSVTYLPVCLCGGQRTSSGAGLHLPPHLKQGFFLFSTMYTKLAGPWAPRNSLFSTPHLTEGMLEIGMYYHFRLYMGSRDLNSGPYTCLTSPLPIWLSLSYSWLSQGSYDHHFRLIKCSRMSLLEEQVCLCHSRDDMLPKWSTALK